MKDEFQQGRIVPTLPAHLTLNEGERAEIERHVAAVDVLCSQTPLESDEWEGATLIVVTKMMLALPSSQQNEAGAEASGEAFQMALEDLPTWAVTSAVRRWYRGDCGVNERGDPYDYHWRPAPAELRKVALFEKWKVKAQADTLRKMLKAEPLIEFSNEHCEQMRARLAMVIPRVQRVA